jgi:TPR repeat protein/CRP-like cAMP-binding protein
LDERQEDLAKAAKRLAGTKLAAVEQQQQQVSQLLDSVRRAAGLYEQRARQGSADLAAVERQVAEATRGAMAYPLVPCTDANFLCAPEIAEAAESLQSLGAACGQFFQLAQERDTAEAHHWLGIRYQTGDGVPQDLAKAVRHFEISAAAGSVDAQFSLACRHLNGEGTTRSVNEGIRLLTLAADQGHPDAQNALATRFFTGNGVAQDTSRAIKYFRMAADGLQRVAAYNLATCYYNGDGIEQDYALAVQYYRQAADAGLPKAQLLLAELYEAGEGLEQDVNMALHYWKLAADQGDPDAQNAFAETTIQQHPDNPEKWGDASKFLAMAAEQGHCDAQYNLAEVLLTSKQADPDSLVNAARWFTRAAEQGHVLATYNLAVCYKHGQGVREDPAEASHYFELAANAGHAAAQYALAWRRYKGQGCEHDLAEAKRLFTLAADQGHAQAAKAAQQFDELTELFQTPSGLGVEEGEPPASTRQAASAKPQSAPKPTYTVDEEDDVLAMLNGMSTDEDEDEDEHPRDHGPDKNLRGLSDRGAHDDDVFKLLEEQRNSTAAKEAQEQEELLASVVGQEQEEEEVEPAMNGHHDQASGKLNVVNDNREDALGDLLAGVVDAPVAAAEAGDDAAQFEAADLAAWESLKDKNWGKQLGVLLPQGWVEPAPDYDEAESLIGKRLFVIEHGFGVLVKAVKKKRGWGPSSIEFRDGGKKMVILRLKGKEMGSPFLIAPDSPVLPTVEPESKPEPEPEPSAPGIGADAAAELQLWQSIRDKSWGQQLAVLQSNGWVEPPAEYDEADTWLEKTLFVMEHGPGVLVKVAKKKRGWGPCSLQFHEKDGAKTMVILRLKGKEMGTPWLYKDPAWVAPSAGLELEDKQDQDDLISSLMGADDSDDSDDAGGDLSLFLDQQADSALDPATKVRMSRQRSSTFSSYEGVVQTNYQSLKTPRAQSPGGGASAGETDDSPSKKNRKRAKAVYAKRNTRTRADDAEYALPVYDKSDEDRDFLLDKLQNKEFLLKFFLRADLSKEQQLDLVGSMKLVQAEVHQELVKQGANGSECYIIQTGSFDCVKKMSRKEYCGLNTNTIRQIMAQCAPEGEIDDMALNDIFGALKLRLSEAEVDQALEEMGGGKGFATHEEFTKWFSKGQTDFHVMAYGSGDCFGELALLYDAPRAATIIAAEPSKLWAIDIDAFKHVVVNGNSARTGQLKTIIKKVEQFSSLGPDALQNMADALHPAEFADGEEIIAIDEPCDENSKFYIIDTGEASVTIRKDGVMKQVAMLAEGKCFGETAILNDQPRNATITAFGPVRCLILTREDFNRILGDLGHLLQRSESGGASGDGPADRMAGTVVTFDDSLREIDFEGMKLSKDDFTHGGILGKGSFGLVSHIRAKGGKHPGKYYAMKAMSKAALIEMDQVSHIMNEKKVMNMCVHPLIVNLHGCYQDDASLYMVMEYIKGGELYSVMNKESKLNNDKARFYAAEILEALVFLHSKVSKQALAVCVCACICVCVCVRSLSICRTACCFCVLVWSPQGIAYRDLKPENILLDGTGHVKITDFGFATPIPEVRVHGMPIRRQHRPTPR